MLSALLTINKLTCHLGGKLILDNISCEFQQGKVTALIGPNGSGKSTLLKLIAGLEKGSAGDIQLSGQGITQYYRADLALKLAMLPQRHNTPVGLTVSDLVEFGRHPHRRWFAPLTKKDRQKMYWAMQQAGVLAFAYLPIETLSGGEAQRCWWVWRYSCYLYFIFAMSYQLSVFQLALVSMAYQVGVVIPMILQDAKSARKMVLRC